MGRKVGVLDGSEAVLYGGKRLRYVVLSEPPKRQERDDGLLSQRQYLPEGERRGWKPPADHPWRRGWKERPLGRWRQARVFPPVW